jgi:ubiquinone/menaquinone biosynthesis C-methylase UbiE
MDANIFSDQVGFKALQKLSDAKKFNKWMYSKITQYIRGNVLEIGAGIGNLTELIKSDRLYPTDISSNYLSILMKKFSNKNNIFPFKLDISTSYQIPIQEKINTIVCLNVLEHIEDDNKALKNMRNILATNGTLIILVPFSNLLYSNLDHLLGHFRRYTKRTLTNVVQSNGFEVNKIFYFNFFGGVGWFISGKFLKKKELSKKSILVFEKLVPFFKLLESMGSPFGASLICIAKKTK